MGPLQTLYGRISIHALCEEGDPMIKPCSVNDLVFLSTPSARRATVYTLNGATKNTDFYPRPLRGGRQVSKNLTAEVYTFLSTPSARRATTGQLALW